MRAQERAPDYRVVAAWSAFLVLIGASAFVLGMAFHTEATAQQHAPRPEPIYYCATGAELPAFEPCRDRKGYLMVDHRELLKKYINHVGNNEGVTFIEPRLLLPEFTADEVAELERLEEESWDDI